MLGLRFGIGALALAAVTVLAAAPAAASGWTAVAVPVPSAGGSLAGISADSGSDAWAVGQVSGGFNTRELIDHWNGSTWQQVGAPGGRIALTAVSAASPTDAWTVGRVVAYGADEVAYHWNGSTWTSTAPRTFRGDSGVADIGPGNAYAVGASLEHWDGTSWAAQAFPDPANPGQAATSGDLRAVSADGAGDVWVVGDYNTSSTCATTCEQTFALHWDGAGWHLAAMPPVVRGADPNLEYVPSAVDVLGPSDVWAAGYTRDSSSLTPLATLIEHWDGTRWSLVPAPSPGSAPALTGIAGSSASSVWAVGSFTPAGVSQPQTLTLLWNGSSWATVPSPSPGRSAALNAVAAAPGTATVWAAGTSQPASGPLAPLVLRNG